MKLIKIPKASRTYLDIIRLLAIVMVVFNHTGDGGYMRYLEVQGEPAHSLILAVSALVKIAVPLFFMTSGALLLNREETWRQVLTGRVLKFLGILVLVSLFYYLEALAPKGTFRLDEFLIHLYKNDLKGHLWYLYSFLCYLLLLPILRKLAQTMQLKDYILLVAVYQAAQLLPVADYALFRGAGAHTAHLDFFTAADYVVYPLLGHFIASREHKGDREEVGYVLLFLSAVAIFYTCFLTDWRFGADGRWTNANREVYLGRLSVLPALTVFYYARKLLGDRPVPEKAAQVLSVLGSCTFGVYLFDPVWRECTYGVRRWLMPSIGPYAASFVQTICACVLGLAATFAFKCAIGAIRLLAQKIAAADDLSA